jgi:hypothetical protein
MLKRSQLEHKLGKYPQAMSWAMRAGKAVEGLPGAEHARQAARSSAWYANVLQAAGAHCRRDALGRARHSRGRVHG